MADLGLGAPCVGEWMGEGPTTENMTVRIVVDAVGDANLVWKCLWTVYLGMPS